MRYIKGVLKGGTWMGWDLLNSSELDPEVAGLALEKCARLHSRFSHITMQPQLRRWNSYVERRGPLRRKIKSWHRMSQFDKCQTSSEPIRVSKWFWNMVLLVWSSGQCRFDIYQTFDMFFMLPFWRFDYYGVGTDDLSKVKQTIFMFIDLFGLEKFDYNTLARNLRIKQLNLFN